MFAHVKGISGSSILGSGDVALILDVPALLLLTLGSRSPRIDLGIQLTVTLLKFNSLEYMDVCKHESGHQAVRGLCARCCC